MTSPLPPASAGISLFLRKGGYHMTELHFSFVARPFSTKLTEAVYYDIVYFRPTWINGVFFFILLLCQDTTIKGSQRRKSLLCPALQSVSPWRPCWPTWQQTDSVMLEEQLGAHRLRRQLPGGEKSWQEWPGLSGPEIHPSLLAHLLQHGHISESCPESSTDFRPSTQTR